MTCLKSHVQLQHRFLPRASNLPLVTSLASRGVAPSPVHRASIRDAPQRPAFPPLCPTLPGRNALRHTKTMVRRYRALSVPRGRFASMAGGVRTRLMAGLSLLVLLIVLAFSLLMWNSRSGEAVHEVDRVEAPASSPHTVGTSALSHGGPAPAGKARPSGAKRTGGPFLEPTFGKSRDSPGSREAGGLPVRGQSPQLEGPSPGSGGQDP